jgi:hypothetical protein
MDVGLEIKQMILPSLLKKQLFYMGWARTSARAGHGGFSE